MLFPIILFLFFFIGCEVPEFNYKSFNSYSKCKNLESRLYSNYGKPDIVRTGKSLSVFEWYVKEKILIFKKFRSGSCNLRVIKIGG